MGTAGDIFIRLGPGTSEQKAIQKFKSNEVGLVFYIHSF